MSNFAIPGFDSDGDVLFDFEAASSDTSWASKHNDLAGSTQTVQDDEAIYFMPLTRSEKEAILAVRASKDQNLHQAHHFALPELPLHTNFSGSDEPGAFGASPTYDNAGILLPANLDEFDMLDSGNTQLNAVDDFPALVQSHFEEPAGALGDFALNATDQSGHHEVTEHNTLPIQYMKQVLDADVSNSVKLLPLQTGESTVQPKHHESIMQAWSVGNKCTWPQCTSKAVFKTRPSFNMHFINIHTHPLLCFVADCSQKTPFGRESDLRRHMQSAHTVERSFVCTVGSCDARIKEFARKDHLTKHMRERHDRYFCPMNHCPHSTNESFAKPEELAEHINRAHGVYECTLEGCAQMPLSKFSYSSLPMHLRNHHHMSEWSEFNIFKRMEERSSTTVIEADLGRLSYRECKTCKKRPNVTK